VYVLHGFQKRTQKTAKRDIEIGADRMRRLMAERRKDER